MGLKTKFALWLAIASLLAGALAAVAGVALWSDLQGTEREALAAMLRSRQPLVIMLALLLPIALGSVLKWAMRAYPAAAVKLAEEVRLIHAVNPAHRVSASGAAEMRQLGAAINELAQAREGLERQVQGRIDEAKAHLAQEKNRLAALMSELAQSVLVCNAEGRILLYNARATRLLEQADAGADMPVGLGRSIFSILDRSPIVHALGQLAHRLEHGTAQPVARFVTTRGGQLLRAQMAPVPDGKGVISGFVLILEDITREVESASQRDQLLQQLTEGSRAALANLRAAAETMQQYPDMETSRRQRFFAVIGDEALKLSRQLESAVAAQGGAPRTPWPLEDMLAGDLVSALRRNLPSGPRIAVHEAQQVAPLWVSVDSYRMVQALTYLAGRVALSCGQPEVGLELAAQGRWVRLSLLWPGNPPDPAVLHEWENEPLSIAAAGEALTLKRVLDQHGAEMWCQAEAGGLQRLCLQLPAAQAELDTLAPREVAGRPVYYDFDLFSQPGQRPELDDRPLLELAYTAFDTETTGLSPSDGDEIISIGAVRILNGRLLEQECFDRLVRPRAPLRRESQAVHGITEAMLAGQPFIERVLPGFHRFAEDTVLVAHNAAFDMRLLQLAQARTGVAFVQPVIDTLLLSALVHPGHADSEHRLEIIAARLGVRVVGRHTALGDAMVTGEVFLKLIPLLAERGIVTLRQAREASQKTLYAKLEY